MSATTSGLRGVLAPGMVIKLDEALDRLAHSAKVSFGADIAVDRQTTDPANKRIVGSAYCPILRNGKRYPVVLLDSKLMVQNWTGNSFSLDLNRNLSISDVDSLHSGLKTLGVSDRLDPTDPTDQAKIQCIGEGLLGHKLGCRDPEMVRKLMVGERGWTSALYEHAVAQKLIQPVTLTRNITAEGAVQHTVSSGFNDYMLVRPELDPHADRQLYKGLNNYSLDGFVTSALDGDYQYAFASLYAPLHKDLMAYPVRINLRGLGKHRVSGNRSVNLYTAATDSAYVAMVQPHTRSSDTLYLVEATPKALVVSDTAKTDVLAYHTLSDLAVLAAKDHCREALQALIEERGYSRIVVVLDPMSAGMSVEKHKASLVQLSDLPVEILLTESEHESIDDKILEGMPGRNAVPENLNLTSAERGIWKHLTLHARLSAPSDAKATKVWQELVEIAYCENSSLDEAVAAQAVIQHHPALRGTLDNIELRQITSLRDLEPIEKQSLAPVFVRDVSATGTGKSHDASATVLAHANGQDFPLFAPKGKGINLYVVHSYRAVPPELLLSNNYLDGSLIFSRGRTGNDLLVAESPSGTRIVERADRVPADYRVLRTIEANCQNHAKIDKIRADVTNSAQAERKVANLCKNECEFRDACPYVQNRARLQAGDWPQIIVTSSQNVPYVVQDITAGQEVGNTRVSLDIIDDDLNHTTDVDTVSLTTHSFDALVTNGEPGVFTSMFYSMYMSLLKAMAVVELTDLTFEDGKWRASTSDEDDKGGPIAVNDALKILNSSTRITKAKPFHLDPERNMLEVLVNGTVSLMNGGQNVAASVWASWQNERSLSERQAEGVERSDVEIDAHTLLKLIQRENTGQQDQSLELLQTMLDPRENRTSRLSLTVGGAVKAHGFHSSAVSRSCNARAARKDKLALLYELGVDYPERYCQPTEAEELKWNDRHTNLTLVDPKLTLQKCKYSPRTYMDGPLHINSIIHASANESYESYHNYGLKPDLIVYRGELFPSQEQRRPMFNAVGFSRPFTPYRRAHAERTQVADSFHLMTLFKSAQVRYPSQVTSDWDEQVATSYMNKSDLRFRGSVGAGGFDPEADWLGYGQNFSEEKGSNADYSRGVTLLEMDTSKSINYLAAESTAGIFSQLNVTVEERGKERIATTGNRANVYNKLIQITQCAGRLRSERRDDATYAFINGPYLASPLEYQRFEVDNPFTFQYVLEDYADQRIYFGENVERSQMNNVAKAIAALKVIFDCAEDEQNFTNWMYYLTDKRNHKLLEDFPISENWLRDYVLSGIKERERGYLLSKSQVARGLLASIFQWGQGVQEQGFFDYQSLWQVYPWLGGELSYWFLELLQYNQGEIQAIISDDASVTALLTQQDRLAGNPDCLQHHHVLADVDTLLEQGCGEDGDNEAAHVNVNAEIKLREKAILEEQAARQLQAQADLSADKRMPARMPARKQVTVRMSDKRMSDNGGSDGGGNSGSDSGPGKTYTMPVRPRQRKRRDRRQFSGSGSGMELPVGEPFELPVIATALSDEGDITYPTQIGSKIEEVVGKAVERGLDEVKNALDLTPMQAIPTNTIKGKSAGTGDSLDLDDDESG